jgi:hypothetical protein
MRKGFSSKGLSQISRIQALVRGFLIRKRFKKLFGNLKMNFDIAEEHELEEFFQSDLKI